MIELYLYILTFIMCYILLYKMIRTEETKNSFGILNCADIENGSVHEAEVFNTLDNAGIKVNFIGGINNE